MSSKTPKKPIPFTNTYKVISDKKVKAKATSSINNTNKKTKSQIEVPAIHQNTQKKMQKNANNSFEQKNIGINSFKPNQTQDKDSNESLKQQIDQLSKISSQQSELISYFQKNLNQVESITENFPNNSKLPQDIDEYASIKYKFQCLIRDYIKKQRLAEVDEIIQQKFGPKYTTAQINGFFSPESRE
ncbi:hypothetical protein M9Y10_040531 [Tritrichomonas musculus]|uniref:Uncharacterized protein n=1 Tax=Tritrichomonas musculus TaxID=1915356 RepID=A0ABR2GQ21_9EUKA